MNAPEGHMSPVLELNLAWFEQNPSKKKMDAKLLSIGILAKLENMNSKYKAFYEGFSLNTKGRA